ncbi:hypothetical protein POKO110462_22190 [Pontibacter korlensis]|uniref:Uncharacterized protein n=1 Tax=Pontibacter korlensis TaxID=400092 RepID=A0A0E3ZCG6_9BACT|nr:hypothetical protein [Pontibacter korlensis]AKD01835.1 hypothetical protein PKOR_00060 [Pontibacter korlensis]
MTGNKQNRSLDVTLNRSGLWYLLFFLIMASSACSNREFIQEENSAEANDAEVVEAEIPYDGKLLAQVVFDTVDYIVPTSELMQPFIREFGDGTVVDKVMIRKVQETKEDEPAYYLVGLGMQNGAFRSMALELDLAADNSLYLSRKGARHICKSSIGCGFCYFTFSGNRITGCACASRAPGNNCEHRYSEGNTLLKDTPLRSTRERNGKKR